MARSRYVLFLRQMFMVRLCGVLLLFVFVLLLLFFLFFFTFVLFSTIEPV